MARWFALPAGLMTFVVVVFGADELPSNDQEESFEVEPPLLIPYREPGDAGHADTDSAAATPAPVVDVERLTKEVERARRSAISAERLFRIGVLAKIEAEQRALKVVRLTADLENARLAQIKVNLVTRDSPKGETTTATSNDADLARAIQAAHAAVKKREEAELEAAQANLARQQKLLSLGSGRKADVAKAERKLAELKAARN